MALQGNLRDFSVNEILQLLGTQRKTGCLMLEWGAERAQIHVLDGRLIGARQPGMKPDDPLLAFLLKVHRLSDDQRRGILSIQRESNRDLEDLLINGRYLDTEELKAFLERQILNELMRVVRWENGTYRFDPKVIWPSPPLVKMSMEGALIEAARRGDEQKRFVSRFKNPYDLLGVRDLPDPDEPLSEEEKELFGIIDGQHTVAEVVATAPLSEYEAYEALDRMLDAQWIEVVGRRDPGLPAPRKGPPPPGRATSPARELSVAALVLAVAIGLRFAAFFFLSPPAHPDAHRDVFAQAQLGEIRTSLDLYRREKGAYPAKLSTLVEDDWMGAAQTRIQGYVVRYHAEPGGQSYRLELEPRP
jgi:hypothetical protein